MNPIPMNPYTEIPPYVNVTLDALVGREWRHLTCTHYEARRKLNAWRKNEDLRGWEITPQQITGDFKYVRNSN